MGLRSKQIGWSVKSNLYYQLLKNLSGENGTVSKEIGWGQEEMLQYDVVKASSVCGYCYDDDDLDCLIMDSDNIVITDSDDVSIEDYCTGDFDLSDFSSIDFT